MGRLRYILTEGLAAAVVLLPVFFVLWKGRLCTLRRAAALFVFSEYLCILYSLVGLLTLPLVPYLRFDPRVVLVPFAEIAENWPNMALNVALFVPMGLLLPILWKDMERPEKTVLMGLTVSLAVELLQTVSGRATDINDLLTNGIGTAFGYGLFRLAPERLYLRGSVGRGMIFVLVVGVMFLIQPWLANLLY